MLDGACEAEFKSKADRAGIGVHPVSALYGEGHAATGQRRAGFIFGYAALEVREIRKGIALLADAVGAPTRAAK